MSAKEQLYTIYKKIYAQRSVLADFGTVTVDLSNETPDTMNYAHIRNEASAIISRLLAVKDINKVTMPDAIKMTEKIYGNQPFWKELIIQWLSFANTEEAEQIQQRATKARKHAEDVLRQIQEAEAQEKATIKAYAEPLRKNKFAIDGEKMMQNYLNMCRKDPKKAWEILISNPGWFSPIITHNKDGEELMTPAQAIEENKKIGKFLKGLSI